MSSRSLVAVTLGMNLELSGIGILRLSPESMGRKLLRLLARLVGAGGTRRVSELVVLVVSIGTDGPVGGIDGDPVGIFEEDCCCSEAVIFCTCERVSGDKTSKDPVVEKRKSI